VKLSIETEYALRALAHLAGRPEGEVVGAAELAAATGVSPAFLSKILQRLTKAGIVRGYRGGRRGYGLAVAADRLSALAVVETLGGPGFFERCVFRATACGQGDACPLHDPWSKAREALASALASLTIAQIAARGEPQPDGVPATVPKPRLRARVRSS